MHKIYITALSFTRLANSFFAEKQKFGFSNANEAIPFAFETVVVSSSEPCGPEP